MNKLLATAALVCLAVTSEASIRVVNPGFSAGGRSDFAVRPDEETPVAFLHSSPYRGVTSSDERMSVRAWEKDGDVYVLACNVLENPLKARVTFADGGWRIVETVLGTPATEVNARMFDFDLPAMGYSLRRFRNEANVMRLTPNS